MLSGQEIQKRKEMLNMLQDGATYREIGIAFGFSGTTAKIKIDGIPIKVPVKWVLNENKELLKENRELWGDNEQMKDYIRDLKALLN